MPLKLLTFDQANLCGYTFGITGEKPKTYVMSLGSTKVASPEYLWRWGQNIKELIGRYEPDAVGWEIPFFSKDTAHAGVRLIKMEAMLEVACYGTRTPHYPTHNASWKSTFCKGEKFNKSTKPYPPIVECEARGIEVDGSTDRADSCGVWFHVAEKIDPKAMANMATPLFGRARA